jgi:hypothetical protein
MIKGRRDLGCFKTKNPKPPITIILYILMFFYGFFLQKVIKDNYIYNLMKTREEKQKFYNTSAWKKIREEHLKDNYYCVICLEQLNYININNLHVHHIISIDTDEGWNKRLDINNLETLCKEHHGTIHIHKKKEIIELNKKDYNKL